MLRQDNFETVSTLVPQGLHIDLDDRLWNDNFGMGFILPCVNFSITNQFHFLYNYYIYI